MTAPMFFPDKFHVEPTAKESFTVELAQIPAPRYDDGRRSLWYTNFHALLGMMPKNKAYQKTA